jgi:hypothetical protein
MLGVLTMGASKLEILRMILLNVIIHGILLLTGLITMRALEMA